MNESIQTAILVLVVGMTTVFFILGLVVVSGKLLISFVNKFLPGKEKYAPSFKSSLRPHQKSKKVVEQKKVAAIVAAVEIFTAGKGRITSIEKVD